MNLKRRKGVAIIESKKGILVVAITDIFILPGGGAKPWESRKKAAIRELYEETKLKAKKATYLFTDVGIKWHNHKGKLVQNYSKIFLIEAEGKAMPRHEIKKIAYYKPGCGLKIGEGSKKIIETYFAKYKK